MQIGGNRVRRIPRSKRTRRHDNNHYYYYYYIVGVTELSNLQKKKKFFNKIVIRTNAYLTGNNGVSV